MRFLLLGVYALGLTLFSLAYGKTEKDAIGLAIPYIEENGEKWIREKKCVSCHQVNSMLWSLSLAKKKGFEVSEKFDQWLNWAVGDSIRKDDKGDPVGHSNKEGVSQLLYGVTELSDINRSRLTDLLTPGQQDYGTWEPGGQLPNQKRPIIETTIVSTMWIALSASEENFKKAKSSIQASKSGKSTEQYALRLLLSEKIGDSPEAILMHAQTLLDLQQNDGGWGWLSNEESDAIGTGFALHALQSIRLEFDSASLGLARKYLVRTQQKNGSWSVKGTKMKKRHTIEETSTYWGTAWAVIALASGLP